MNTQEQTNFSSEQEAAVAILFSCILHNGRTIENRHIEHLSRMLLLSQKFAGLPLEPLAEKVLPLLKAFGTKKVIEHSALHISVEFKETLFAMVCEIMTNDGDLSDPESEIVGLTALYLGVPIDGMRMMLSTFLIRNRWNV